MPAKFTEKQRYSIIVHRIAKSRKSFFAGARHIFYAKLYNKRFVLLKSIVLQSTWNKHGPLNNEHPLFYFLLND